MSKLLQVNDLTTEFTGDFGKKISVDHVSFDVAEGETVCIVGESGCGKSVTSLSIMGLLGRGGAVVDGSVLFANKNLLDMDEKQLDTIRGNQMTMIFQDPLTSLNPVFTIGSQITESIRIHMHLSKKEAGERAVTVPTVERGLWLVVFWSMEMAGDRPVISSTSGLSIRPRNIRA